MIHQINHYDSNNFEEDIGAWKQQSWVELRKEKKRIENSLLISEEKEGKSESET